MHRHTRDGNGERERHIKVKIKGFVIVWLLILCLKVKADEIYDTFMIHAHAGFVGLSHGSNTLTMTFGGKYLPNRPNKHNGLLHILKARILLNKIIFTHENGIFYPQMIFSSILKMTDRPHSPRLCCHVLNVVTASILNGNMSFQRSIPIAHWHCWAHGLILLFDMDILVLPRMERVFIRVGSSILLSIIWDMHVLHDVCGSMLVNVSQRSSQIQPPVL